MFRVDYKDPWPFMISVYLNRNDITNNELKNKHFEKINGGPNIIRITLNCIHFT